MDLKSQAEEISLTIQTAPIPEQIEWRASRRQMKKLLARVRAAWTQMGTTEPFWSVLVNPDYRAQKRLDQAKADEFYNSGEQEVAQLLQVLRRNHIDPGRLKSVIEMGCGLSRVGIPLQKAFGNYLGIDVSEAHLEIAREAAAQRGAPGARFMSVDRLLIERPRADLIYSLITLQHNPPPLIVYLIDRMLRALNPGGVAVFQVPCALWGYSFDTANYLANAHGVGGMEMHALPQAAIFRTAVRAGCEVLEANLCGRIGDIGLSYAFVISRPKRWWHRLPLPL